MKIVEMKWFPILLQKVITLAMICGSIMIAALPIIVDYGLKYYEEISASGYYNQYYLICLLILYPSGLLGLGILHQARGIVKKVNESQPFIMENVRRMKYIARFTAGLCMIYAVALFFVASVFVPILFVVFGLTALFTAVFGELFHKAVIYKEENDFTI